MQGAALHPQTGLLWTHEHGPQGGDEVNVIRAGVNYGWPVITYGVQLRASARKSAKARTRRAWRSRSTTGCRRSRLPAWRSTTGERFPRWRGDLFVGALRDQMLVRLRLDGEKVVKEERMLKGVLGRIRDVRDGPDGLLYLLTDEPNGRAGAPRAGRLASLADTD